MSNHPADSTPSPATHVQFWLAPHRLVLTIMWLATTIAIVIMLWLDVQDTGQYRVVRMILQVGYVAALLWYLSRTGPSISQLPELHPLVFPRWRYSVWIPVSVVGIIFILIAISDGDLLILALPVIVASWWILLAWRRQIRFRSILQGLALALLVYLAGLPMFNKGYISATAFYGLLINVPPMYIAGGLLFNRTDLGGIQLWAKRYRHCAAQLSIGLPAFRSVGPVQCRRRCTRNQQSPG